MDLNAEMGLAHLWHDGDLVSKGIALILLLMSLASWTVIIVKALGLRRHARQARALDVCWQAARAGAAQAPAALPDNPFQALALEGREASLRHASRPQLRAALGSSEWLTRALRASLDDSTAGLQSGLAVLASVGSTAPFVGLFGTVWGIYHALLAMGSAGQATIDKVAGPVGEALIMTALGLAVAIPAVLGHNALVRGNKNLLLQLHRFARALHDDFVGGVRADAIATSSASAAVPLHAMPVPGGA